MSRVTHAAVRAPRPGRRSRSGSTLGAAVLTAALGGALLAPTAGAAPRLKTDGKPRAGSSKTGAVWAERARAAAGDVPGPFVASDALKVAAAPDGSRMLETASGRRVLLRGANVNGLVDYGGVHGAVGITSVDGEQARAVGLNVVRLAVSWSRIMPAPNSVDQAYVEQVRSAARVFADRGIYVLIDMHQDRYAANLGQPTATESDGAPRWAVDTQGASCDFAASTLMGYASYYTTACAAKAAEGLFQNRTVAGRPLQDAYGDAVTAMAGVGKTLGPAFAGIELYNEPRSEDPSLPDAWVSRELWPMYTKLIGRLRGAGMQAPIWFDSVGALASRFSDDGNLVYAPHLYTDVFGRFPDDGTAERQRTDYAKEVARARTFGAAMVVGEYPGARGGVWEAYRQTGLQAQDKALIGGIMWVWKQHPTKDYGWGLLQPSGALQPEGQVVFDLGRPRMVTSAPTVVSQGYDGTTMTLVTRGAGIVELWNGVASGAAAGRGRAPVLTVDGARPTARMTVKARTLRATLPSGPVGGQRIRLRLPAGEHTLRLKP
ncbi:glycoside hydrolase family 5 protein [Patulibacter minatonensis]|uniref:glycoside hydrolase family 5 protein n=1 Tax=Patulibacter minatonensis TaxID=298163 RepID=UPI0012FC72C9|nr:cellulase family glycosylhydrolase [Patulibacter minatonensis]